ncbi:flagellar hook-length control protein FliK, partial [Desulfurella sp.]|uniref:flagellar hook-length control protein FliK n=1 Tax=Desulfurella sp. TaxID=1962857 RepID=UPI0025B87EF5
DILSSLEELVNYQKEAKGDNSEKNTHLSKDDIIALLSLIQNIPNANFQSKESQNSKTASTIDNDALQKLSEPAINSKYSTQIAKENIDDKNAQLKDKSHIHKIAAQIEIEQKLTQSNTENSKLLDDKSQELKSNKPINLQNKTQQTQADQKENTSFKQILTTKINGIDENLTKEKTPTIKSPNAKPDAQTNNNQTKEDPLHTLKVAKDEQYNKALSDKPQLNGSTKINQNSKTKNISQAEAQSKPDTYSSKQTLEDTENKISSPKDQPKINYQNNTSNIQIKDIANSASQNKPQSENSQSQQNQPQEPQNKFTIDNKTLKTLFTMQNQPNTTQTQELQQKPLIEEKTLSQIKPDTLTNNQNQTQNLFNLQDIPSLQKTQNTLNANVTKQTYPINHIIEKIIELQNLKPPIIKTIQIQLNPPSLGQIDVKVSIDASKTLSASIHVDNQEVLNLLNNNLDTLKTTILQQGINVSQISVTSSNSSQQNLNQNQNQQNQAFSNFNQNFNQSDNGQNSFNQAFNQQKQQNYVFENNTKQIKRIFRKTNALLDISI